MVEPARLLGDAPTARGPTSTAASRASAGSASAAPSSPTGSTTAFAGAALEGGTKGTFINVFNALQNGRYFRSGPCPHPSQGEEIDTLSPLEMQILSQFFPATQGLEPMPDYPPGRQCNRKGLTKLGAYLVRRLMANHMLIEVDHMSELARERVLQIAGRARLPARLEPHRHRRKLDRRRAPQPLPARRLRLGDARRRARAGREDPRLPRLPRPRSLLRRRARHRHRRLLLAARPRGRRRTDRISVHAATAAASRFRRQRTGERTFDLNEDGVAHYGLFADLLDDDAARSPTAPQAMRTAVPLRRGLPADVGARPARQLTRSVARRPRRRCCEPDDSGQGSALPVR